MSGGGGGLVSGGFAGASTACSFMEPCCGIASCKQHTANKQYGMLAAAMPATAARRLRPTRALHPPARLHPPAPARPSPFQACNYFGGGFVSDDDRVCLQSIKFAHARSAGSRSQDNLAALRNSAGVTSRRMSEDYLVDDAAYMQLPDYAMRAGPREVGGAAAATGGCWPHACCGWSGACCCCWACWDGAACGGRCLLLLMPGASQLRA